MNDDGQKMSYQPPSTFSDLVTVHVKGEVQMPDGNGVHLARNNTSLPQVTAVSGRLEIYNHMMYPNTAASQP